MQFPGSQCSPRDSNIFDSTVYSIALSRDGNFLLAQVENYWPQGANLSYFSRGSVTPSWTVSNTRISGAGRVTMSADGSYSSVGGYNSYQVGLWNRDGQIVWWFPQTSLLTNNYISSPATSVEISGNGQYTAVRTWEPGLFNSLYFLRTSTGVPLWHYNFSDVYHFQESLAISYEGGYVAAVQNGNLFLFGQHDNTTIWSARAMATRVEMSSTGDRIIAANSTTISLYTVATNATQWTKKPTMPINSLDVSSDGSTLAVQTGNNTWSSPQTVSIWDAASGRPLFTLSQALLTGFSSQMSLSSDGSRILLNGPNRKSEIFDRSGRQVCSLPASQTVISEDGSLVVSYYGGVWATVPASVTLLSLQDGTTGLSAAVVVSIIAILLSRTETFSGSKPPENYLGNYDAIGYARRQLGFRRNRLS